MAFFKKTFRHAQSHPPKGRNCFNPRARTGRDGVYYSLRHSALGNGSSPRAWGTFRPASHQRAGESSDSVKGVPSRAK